MLFRWKSALVGHVIVLGYCAFIVLRVANAKCQFIVFKDTTTCMVTRFEIFEFLFIDVTVSANQNPPLSECK